MDGDSWQQQLPIDNRPEASSGSSIPTFQLGIRNQSPQWAAYPKGGGWVGGDVRAQVKRQKCVRLMSMREGEKGRGHVITRTYLRVFVQGAVRSKRTLPPCERTICRDTHARARTCQLMDDRGNSNGQAGANRRVNARNSRNPPAETRGSGLLNRDVPAGQSHLSAAWSAHSWLTKIFGNRTYLLLLYLQPGDLWKVYVE